MALRYNHRISDDIDLFVPDIIGSAELGAIQEEVVKYYKDTLLYCEVINAELGDQFCFLRAFIGKKYQEVSLPNYCHSIEPTEK